jgi:ActR/RegA family two-component response regulator
LVDHHLGHESGLDLVRELQVQYPEVHTILMTGFGSLCAIPGGSGVSVIEKPFEIAQLLATLALDVSRWVER